MSISEPCFAYFDLPNGPVTFPPKIARITRTREFVRLHGIKQLSTVYLLYPYATHTRAHHSLGVATLVKFYIDSLPLDEFKKISLEEHYCLLVAALLHDIGHPAWSHVGEEFGKFFKEEPVTHDLLSADLTLENRKYNKYYRQWNTLPSVAEVLKQEEKKQKFHIRTAIARLILGLTPFVFHWKGDKPPKKLPRILENHKKTLLVEKAWMGKMIHSELDFDRADYLRRDSYFTLGLPGLSDPISLVEKVKIDRTHLTSDLAFTDLPYAEGFFIGHELMYPAVYVKAENLVLEELLLRALYKTYPSPDQDFLRFWFSTDEQVLEKMRKKARTDDFVRRVCNLIDTHSCYEATERDFSKLSVTCRDNLEYLERFKYELPAIEQEICQACKEEGVSIGEGDVVIGISLKKPPKGGAVIIITEKGRRTLDDESPLLDVMSTSDYQQKKSRLVLGLRPGIASNNKSKIMDICIQTVEDKKYDLSKIEKHEQRKKQVHDRLKKKLGGDW